MAVKLFFFNIEVSLFQSKLKIDVSNKIFLQLSHIFNRCHFVNNKMAHTIFKIGDYKYRTSILNSYKCDSTVTLKRSFLRYLPWVNHKDQPLELPKVKSYTMVNSYYSFTEDVDAFARVNHLVEDKESVGSLPWAEETYKRKKLCNEYSYVRIQQQYLGSRPLCFLILGKPNFEQEEIGRRLSEYWKCVYIDPHVLLEEAIASNTRAGNCIEFNLRSGRALDAQVIIRLLSKKVRSPSVLHRGFVLCGFPLVFNNLLVEDPISSESAVFNVQEIFEDIVENSILTEEQLNENPRSTVVSRESIECTAEVLTPEFEDGTENNKAHTDITWSVDGDNSFSSSSSANISLDFKKQLKFLFSLFSDPYLIIYIYGLNSDVVSKRSNYYWDFISRKQVDLEKLKLFCNIGASNEELVEDLFGGNRNPFLNNPTMKHLVKFPENMLSNVRTQLDLYHTAIASSLDTRIMKHTHQLYIKLDGRLFISEMINLIKKRIDILGVPNVLLPKRHLLPQRQSFVENVGEEEQVPLSLQQVFFRLSAQNVVAPMFLWDWSNWGVYCPVSMFNGEYRKGSPDWAVQFMNQIFFLSNEDAFYQFYENPRTFLLPPFPKPGSNLVIFGPPMSGKSIVAKCLGYILNSTVLHPDNLVKNYVAQKMFEKKESVKQAAIAEALEMLKIKKVTEFEQQLEHRENQINEWEKTVLKYLRRLHEIFELSKKTEVSISSASPEKANTTAAQQMSDLNECENVKNILSQFNIPHIDCQQLCAKLLSDRSFLYTYLPKDFQSQINLAEPSVFDEFVSNYVNQKVEITQSEVDDDYISLDVFSWAFQDLGQYDGWIIDAMITDINVLKQFCEKWRPHDVIILTKSNDLEKNDNFKFLEKSFDYRNFFLNIGEKDAAFRCSLIENGNSEEFIAISAVLENILNVILNGNDVSGNNDDNYKEKLVKYEYDIEAVESLLAEMDFRPLKVYLNKPNIKELLIDVIDKLRNKYRSEAIMLTEEHRAQELHQILTQQRDNQENESSFNYLTDVFYKKRRYGDTDYYCPVTFFNNFVFWRGKEEFAARFEGRVYLMANEENYKTFLKCPRTYLFQSPPNRLPPPRICLMGLPQSGKTTVSKALAKNLGVRHILFSDFSRILKNNMRTAEENNEDSSLPPSLNDCYDKIFSSLWFKDPVKHSGFVFDGFPESDIDINYMVKKRAIPDVIICIIVKREEYIDRLVTSELKKWQDSCEENRKHQNMMELMNQQRKQFRYNELMESKREQRYAAVIKTNSDSKGEITSTAEEGEAEHEIGLNLQISTRSVDDFKDEIEVRKKLDEEFPESVLKYFEELEETARKRIILQVENQYNKWINCLDAIRVACEAELISFVEVDGSDLDKCAIKVFQATELIKFRGVSCFERCYDVSTEIAEKLLKTGYCFLSFFGRTCPVTFNVGANPVHTYLGSLGRNEVFPVLHRQYVYYIDGKGNRDKFFQNPLKYINPENYCSLCIPSRIGIIGPPRAGKTVLAKRFRNYLGFKIITRGQAIRFVLEHLLFNNLSSSIKKILCEGKELSDDVVMECVQAATFCGESLTHGLLFDGFPNTIKEVDIMSRLGLIPHLIYDLRATEDVVLNHAPSVEKYLPYSERFTKHLFCKWRDEHEDFYNWCHREYQNICKVFIDCSSWGVWKHVVEITFSVLYERKQYYEFAKEDKPLRLTYMLVTPLEYLERRSEYKNYCPVCYYYFRSLNRSDDPPDRSGLIHFREFYWICDQHVEMFLNVPEKYLPPSNVCLPQDLPEIIFCLESNENILENEFCVVCYRAYFPKRMLKKGSRGLAVKYQNKVFLFDEINCMEQFMSQPLDYSNVTIHFKNEESYSGLDYKDLPVLGMLEQFVAREIVAACCNVNKLRPVIPGLSLSSSALVCFGLYLKVHNTTLLNNMVQYKKGYEKFNRRRLKLLNYLQLMKQYLNIFLHYEEPEMSNLQETFELEGVQEE